MFEYNPTLLKTDESLPGFLGRLKNKILECILLQDCDLGKRHKNYLAQLNLDAEEKAQLATQESAAYLNVAQSLPVGIKNFIFEQAVELRIDATTVLRIYNGGPSAFNAEKTYSGFISVVDTNAVENQKCEKFQIVYYLIEDPFNELPQNVINLLTSTQVKDEFSSYQDIHSVVIDTLRKYAPIFNKENKVYSADSATNMKEFQGTSRLQLLNELLDRDKINPDNVVLEKLYFPDISVYFKETESLCDLEYKVSISFDITNKSLNVLFFAPILFTFNLSDRSVQLPSFKDELKIPNQQLSPATANTIVDKTLQLISADLDP